MSTVNKKPLFIAVIAIAAFLIAGPLVVSLDGQGVFAVKLSDKAAQGLAQEGSSAQSSEVFSENGTSTSFGNNTDLSLNLNDGKNALGQH